MTAVKNLIAQSIHDINPTTIQLYRERVVASTVSTSKSKRSLDETSSEHANDKFFESATFISLSNTTISCIVPLTELNIGAEQRQNIQDLSISNSILYDDEVVLSHTSDDMILVRNRKRNKITVKPLLKLSLDDFEANRILQKDFKFTNSTTIKTNPKFKYLPPKLTLKCSKANEANDDFVIELTIKYEILVIESLILPHSYDMISNIRDLVTCLINLDEDLTIKRRNSLDITPDIFYRTITDNARMISMKSENEKSNLFIEDLDTDLLTFQIDSVKWMLSKEKVYYDETTRTIKSYSFWNNEEYISDEEILSKLNDIAFGFRIIKLSSTTSEPSTHFFNRFTSNICSRDSAVDLLNKYVRTDNHLSKAAKGILAEEMGLGKTIELVSLALLNSRPHSQANETFISNEREVARIRGTLVIVPDTILHQWIDEIQLHAPKVKVFWYKGMKAHSKMSNSDLKEEFKQADFIITSYTVITAEVHSALYNPNRIKRTRTKTTRATPSTEYQEWLKQDTKEQKIAESGGSDIVPPLSSPDDFREDLDTELSFERIDHSSPLVMVEFWRLIWDESQMVGGLDTNVCTMSTLIPRFHSWSVSGTPIKNNSVDDLISTLIFLSVDPFNNNKRNYFNLSTEEFVALFRKLAIRHTKEMVKDQINIPPQQRILLAAPFGKIQQDLYDTSFKNFLSDVGLDEFGNPIVENWEPSASYYESMNEWLKKLRRLSCHPFLVMAEAGRSYRQSKRNAKKLGSRNVGNTEQEMVLDEFDLLKASAQSMSVVLNKLIDDLNDKTSQMERESILSHIELGQICEFEQKPLEALKIWEDQLAVVKDRIEVNKKRSLDLEDERKEADVRSETNDFVDEKIEVNHQTLKSSLELLHRLYFFIANAHYQAYNKHDMIGANNEDQPIEVDTEPDRERTPRVLTPEELKHQKAETEFYSKAQAIRREILRDSIDEVKTGLTKFENLQRTRVNLSVLEGFPLREFEDLDSKTFMIRINSVINQLNSQQETIDNWEKEIIRLFKLPLFDANSEPSGEEYTSALDSQGNISVYLDFLQKIIRDRDVLISGRAATVTEMSLESIDHQTSEESQLLRSKLKEEYDSGVFKERYSLRTLLIDSRSLLNQQGNTERENLRLNDAIFKSKKIFETQREDLESLKKKFRFLNSIYNSQIKYYRQLQAISDYCRSFTPETHQHYDVYDNRRKLKHRIQNVNTFREKINQRLRFLKSIDEEEICTICRCSITIGSFTKCGHRFCKDCLNEWMKNKPSCPICKERVQKQDIYEFTLNRDEIHINQRVEHHDSNSEALDENNKHQLEQLYSKYSEQDLLDLNTIKIRNDYGTKINLIVRQILYLKEKDDNVQILVYSQWSDFLVLISKALEENGIEYLSSKHTLPKVAGSGKTNIKASIQEFKSNPNITCFLLNSRSNSSGLNLVNAAHVFLCEPLVQTALELQAISRIHRIGQKSPTTIWCFIIKDTIEESIILLSTRKKIKEHESFDTRELTKNSKNLLSKTGEVVDDFELWNSFFSSKINNNV